MSMSIGKNIKKLREERKLKQQDIADLIGMHRSNYSKIENEQREISIAACDKIAVFFGITIDELLHPESTTPKEVTIQDKTVLEKLKLIEDLEVEDKEMVFKMIDTCLTKQKFKNFFQEQLAS